MNIFRATKQNLGAVANLYQKIHDANEAGRLVTGWIRDVYPASATAEAALASDSLFVLEEEGIIKGAAIIDQNQHESYINGNWQNGIEPGQVMVIHTLVIDPDSAGAGLGKAFLRYYADLALASGCPYLRLDTNAINSAARSFYRKIGFNEAGIVKTQFNGLGEISLVLLEAEADRILRNPR